MNERVNENSIRLLEAKERKEETRKKKEASIPSPTWAWSDRCALGRNRLQRARVHMLHATTPPVLSQSNNLLATSVAWPRSRRERKCTLGEKEDETSGARVSSSTKQHTSSRHLLMTASSPSQSLHWRIWAIWGVQKKRKDRQQ